MVHPHGNNHDGFTMIELLISVAIFSIIVAAVVSFSIAQRKYLAVQGQISEMMQNARASMDMISGELSIARYDPTGAAFTGIPYSASQLHIYADINGNGTLTDVTDTNEDIIYSYDATNKRIVRNTGGGNQPVAENVQNFTFEYLDANSAATVDPTKIRQIRLTITVRTSKPDPQYSANSGYRTFTLTSVVTPRNLAF
jgi:prepilin-type N-terminal cleavage/methylation domain-containing protein